MNPTAEEMGHSATEHALHEAHNKRVRNWIIGGAVLTAGLVAAPYLLPNLFDIGVEEAMASFQRCNGMEQGIGIAGWAGDVLSHVPMIGAELAKGSWVNGIASAGIGIGGALLGSYVDKQDDGTSKIKWGKVIRTLALATSLFVSIPAVLPGITMGLVFATKMMPFLSAATANVISNGIINTLGLIPGMVSGVSGGLAAGSLLWPHLLSCGVSFGLGSTAIGAGATASKRSRDGKRVLGKHTERLSGEREVKPEMAVSEQPPTESMPHAPILTSPNPAAGYAPAR